MMSIFFTKYVEARASSRLARRRRYRGSRDGRVIGSDRFSGQRGSGANLGNGSGIA